MMDIGTIFSLSLPAIDGIQISWMSNNARLGFLLATFAVVFGRAGAAAVQPPPRRYGRPRDPQHGADRGVSDAAATISRGHQRCGYGSDHG